MNSRKISNRLLALSAMFSLSMLPVLAQRTPDTYQTTLTQTIQQYDDDNIDKAGTLARKLITLDAKRYEGHYYVALIQLRHLDYTAAEASLKMALSRAPEAKKAMIGKLLADVQSTHAYTVALKEAEAAEQGGLKARAAHLFADAARIQPSHTDIALKAAQMLFDLGEVRDAALLAAIARDAATEEAQRIQAALRVDDWRPAFGKEADVLFTQALRQLKKGQTDEAQIKEALATLEQVAPLTQDRNEGFLALLTARFAAGNQKQAIEIVRQWIRWKPAKMEPLADTRVARYYGTEIITRLLADPQIAPLLSDAFGAPALAQTIVLVTEHKTAQEPASTYKTRINIKDGSEMVLVPSGKFMMGDPDRTNNPRQTPRLNAYWIYTKPVTVLQYKRFCTNTSRNMPPAPAFNPSWSKEDHPMVNVSWEDATAYAAWAGVRLPTEAEWEKAARGIDGSRFPWGNDFDNTKLWCSVNDKRPGTAPAGSCAEGASVYGILDMAGNIWQWCSDIPMVAPPKGNGPPQRATPSPLRVLRGGSWDDQDKDLFRSSYRNWFKYDIRFNTVGFRCAATL